VTAGVQKKAAGAPISVQRALDLFLSPLLNIFVRLNIKPNGLTIIGVILSIPVTWCLAHGEWIAAALWLLGAGFFDVLDGALARVTRSTGIFGAFFDSTMDRISEALVFLGFILYYCGNRDLTGAGLAFAVCLLSQLISYTRARAEGLGLRNDQGWVTRPVRILLLAGGLLIGQPAAILWVLAVLSLVTVFQRIDHVFQMTKRVRKTKN
jgi:CDP-diacylglycerol--glycerol-3-phosphate 3-phosphatidyltransferase